MLMQNISIRKKKKEKEKKDAGRKKLKQYLKPFKEKKTKKSKTVFISVYVKHWPVGDEKLKMKVCKLCDFNRSLFNLLTIIFLIKPLQASKSRH